MTGRDTGHLLVGVDGSVASHAALRYAVRLGRALGHDVTTVLVNDDRHSWDWVHPYDGFDPIGDAHAYLERVVGEQTSPAEFAVIRRAVVSGRIVDSLVQRAGAASMLVVGNRGHGRLVGAVLGSVSGGCAARARCPVVVVHADPTLAGDATPTRHA